MKNAFTMLNGSLLGDVQNACINVFLNFLMGIRGHYGHPYVGRAGYLYHLVQKVRHGRLGVPVI